MTPAPSMDPALHAQVSAWRRRLHQHPELSLQERETAAFVAQALHGLGIPFTPGVGGHGVVATLARGNSNRSVGLRADMDALPITETTGLPHASQTPGVMHACGHDGHTASLLGAAALLARDPTWSGTVQLVFQPAEEGSGGARAMIADGLFTRFPMERIFGYHNWPGLDAGTIMLHDGPVMAAGARVEITVEGHAGHAAMPHLAKDPMLAAAHLLIALQSIVARNVSPLDSAVVSICTVDGGSAANQIPSRAIMRGTMRTYRPQVRDLVEAAIHRVAQGTAATFDVTADVAITPGVSATVNHPAETTLAVEAAACLGAPLRRDLAPSMAGEDFGWYLEQCPGAFAWIGNGIGGADLHNPAYDFNDAILPTAAGWLAATARRSLEA